MKSIKMTVLAISILGIVFCLTPQVFATGSPAPGDVCCMVVNPGKSATAFKATMALVYDHSSSQNLDVTLRMTKTKTKGTKFFRLNLTDYTLRGLTDEAIICMILNPENTFDSRVADFVEAIRTAFDLSDTTRLVITAYSASDYMGVYDCGTPEPSDCYIPETAPPRVSTLGELTIYAVENDRYNPVTQTCLLP